MAALDEYKRDNYTCMITLSVVVGPTQRDNFSFSGNFYFEPGTDRLDALDVVKIAAFTSAGLSSTLNHTVQFFYMDKAFLGS